MSSDNPDQQRSSCLMVLITLGVGGSFLMLLVLITGGWLLYLCYVLIGIAVFGAIHYFLWGRLMLRETADERERERQRRRDETPPWPPPPESNGSE
jgi:hypothetical protein